MAGGGSRIDGVALASVGAGALLMYAGITGKDIPAALRAMITGQSPKASPQTHPIQQVTQVSAASANVSGNLGSGSGAAIAADALRYVGTMRYVFGGAPAQGVVDCSSFANMVIGRDEGLAIPLLKAGGYDGSSHGPPTDAWAVWPGCVTVGHDGNQAQPGDIAVWVTLPTGHMGICIGPNQMVSAQNPADGIKVSAINGFDSGILYIRRLKAIGAAQPSAAPGPGGILPTPTGLPNPQIGVIP